MEDLLLSTKHNIIFNQVNWFIIGAESGNRKGKVTPKREWIENIVNECRAHNIPVFLKNSLADIWGEPLIKEFPESLQHKPLSDKLQKKLYAKCKVCGAEHLKKDMTAILYREKRGDSAKEYGYECKNCFNSIKL